MNHQPFDQWIFENTLTNDQTLELEKHIKECLQCKEIKEGWDAVQYRLQSSPMASPTPGFTDRWQSTLYQKRLEQQSKQLKIFITVISVMIISLIMLLSILLMNTRSVLNVFVNFLQMITNLLILAEDTAQFILLIAQNLPPILPLAIWMLLTSGFTCLTMVWIASIWRISTQGALRL